MQMCITLYASEILKMDHRRFKFPAGCATWTTGKNLKKILTKCTSNVTRNNNPVTCNKYNR